MLPKVMNGMSLRRWVATQVASAGTTGASSGGGSTAASSLGINASVTERNGLTLSSGPRRSPGVVRETVTSDMTRRRLVAQRESGMRALQNALAGIGKLSAAESAFALGKSLVEQVRELASTANDVGADRAAIASEVNGLLAQAKDVVKGATYEGKRLFSGVAAEIRVPTGGGSGRSFGVKLSGKQTFTLTDTSQPVKEWTQLLGGTGDESVVGRGIGVDGGLYPTGTTRSTQLDGKTVNGLRDSYIIKVNPDGSKAWTQLVGGAGGDDGDSLVFDPSGSVFIAGVTDSAEVDGQTSNGGVDVFIS